MSSSLSERGDKVSYRDVFRHFGFQLPEEQSDLPERLQQLFATKEEVRQINDLVIEAAARSESEKQEALTTLINAETECLLLDEMDPFYLTQRQQALAKHCQMKLAEWEEEIGRAGYRPSGGG